MGAKDWMLIYADGPIRPVLQAAPPPDRDAGRALVARLHPGRHIAELPDGTVEDDANPLDGHVRVACLPGVTVVCSEEVALDRPSQIRREFLTEAHGRTVFLHAMHSVVDWFAYAVWNRRGDLVRSISLSPDSGIMENIGPPLDFEAAYWAGHRPVSTGAGRPYPLPFHPLELAEDALRELFGFTFEGRALDDDPDLERIVLPGFTLS